MDLTFDGFVKLLDKIPAVIAVAITLGLLTFVFTDIDVTTAPGAIRGGFIWCASYLAVHGLSELAHWVSKKHALKMNAIKAFCDANRERQNQIAEQRRKLLTG
jgi:hypothetical protein